MPLKLKTLHDWHNSDVVSATLDAGGHTEELHYGHNKTLDELKDPAGWHLNWVDVLDKINDRHSSVVIEGWGELRTFHAEAAELLKKK